MESNTDYLTRSIGQFKSARTAKVVQPKTKKTEWQEQIALCKWIKANHPNILFRSDIQSAGKLSGNMQNIKSIIDPFRGFPDVLFFHKPHLAIELKAIGTGLYLKSGELSKDKHVQEQHEMHELLRAQGWTVYFAEGCEEAIEIFKRHYNL